MSESNQNDNTIVNFERAKADDEKEEKEREALFMQLNKSVKAILRCIAEGKVVDSEVESGAKLVDVVIKIASHGLEGGKTSAEVLQKGLKAESAELSSKFHATYGNAGEQTTVKFLLNSHALSKTLEVVVKSFSGDYAQYAALSYPESSEMILGLVSPLDDFDFDLTIEKPIEQEETNPFIEPTPTVIVDTPQKPKDKEKNKEKEKMDKEKDAEIERLKAIIEEQTVEIMELKETIASNDEAIARMTKRIEEQETLIQSLRQQIIDMNTIQPTAPSPSPSSQQPPAAFQPKPQPPQRPGPPSQQSLSESASTNPFDDYNDSTPGFDVKEGKSVNPFEDDESSIPEKAPAQTNPFMAQERKESEKAAKSVQKPQQAPSRVDKVTTPVRNVKRISVYANTTIRFIEFEFDDGAIVSQGTPRDGVMTCYLNGGVFINAIYGRKTNALDRILIKFNNGESFGPFGSTDGPDTFVFFAEENESLQDVRFEKKGILSTGPSAIIPVWKRYK